MCKFSHIYGWRKRRGRERDRGRGREREREREKETDEKYSRHMFRMSTS
jgi:hypothetical protein